MIGSIMKYQGAPVRLFCELVCSACDNEVQVEVFAPHEFSHLHISYARSDEILLGLQRDGWFVHQSRWYCPHHELKVDTK